MATPLLQPRTHRTSSIDHQFAHEILGKYGFASESYLGRLGLIFRLQETEEEPAEESTANLYQFLVNLQVQIANLQHAESPDLVIKRSMLMQFERIMNTQLAALPSRLGGWSAATISSEAQAARDVTGQSVREARAIRRDEVAQRVTGHEQHRVLRHDAVADRMMQAHTRMAVRLLQGAATQESGELLEDDRTVQRELHKASPMQFGEEVAQKNLSFAYLQGQEQGMEQPSAPLKSEDRDIARRANASWAGTGLDSLVHRHDGETADVLRVAVQSDAWKVVQNTHWQHLLTTLRQQVAVQPSTGLEAAEQRMARRKRQEERVSPATDGFHEHADQTIRVPSGQPTNRSESRPEGSLGLARELLNKYVAVPDEEVRLPAHQVQGMEESDVSGAEAARGYFARYLDRNVLGKLEQARQQVIFPFAEAASTLTVERTRARSLVADQGMRETMALFQSVQQLGTMLFPAQESGLPQAVQLWEQGDLFNGSFFGSGSFLGNGSSDIRMVIAPLVEQADVAQRELYELPQVQQVHRVGNVQPVEEADGPLHLPLRQLLALESTVHMQNAVQRTVQHALQNTLQHTLRLTSRFLTREVARQRMERQSLSSTPDVVQRALRQEETAYVSTPANVQHMQVATLNPILVGTVLDKQVSANGDIAQMPTKGMQSSIQVLRRPFGSDEVAELLPSLGHWQTSQLKKDATRTPLRETVQQLMELVARESVETSTVQALQRSLLAGLGPSLWRTGTRDGLREFAQQEFESFVTERVAPTAPSALLRILAQERVIQRYSPLAMRDRLRAETQMAFEWFISKRLLQATEQQATNSTYAANWQVPLRLTMREAALGMSPEVHLSQQPTGQGVSLSNAQQSEQRTLRELLLRNHLPNLLPIVQTFHGQVNLFESSLQDKQQVVRDVVRRSVRQIVEHQHLQENLQQSSQPVRQRLLRDLVQRNWRQIIEQPNGLVSLRAGKTQSSQQKQRTAEESNVSKTAHRQRLRSTHADSLPPFSTNNLPHTFAELLLAQTPWFAGLYEQAASQAIAPRGRTAVRQLAPLVQLLHGIQRERASAIDERVPDRMQPLVRQDLQTAATSPWNVTTQPVWQQVSRQLAPQGTTGILQQALQDILQMSANARRQGAKYPIATYAPNFRQGMSALAAQDRFGAKGLAGLVQAKSRFGLTAQMRAEDGMFPMSEHRLPSGVQDTGSRSRNHMVTERVQGAVATMAEQLVGRTWLTTTTRTPLESAEDPAITQRNVLSARPGSATHASATANEAPVGEHARQARPLRVDRQTHPLADNGTPLHFLKPKKAEPPKQEAAVASSAPVQMPMQMNQMQSTQTSLSEVDINRIVKKVYRDLESKLKREIQKRGL